MAISSFLFVNQGLAEMVDADIGTVTLTAALITHTETPNRADSTYADVSTNVCADGDYAEVDLTGLTINKAAGPPATVTISNISFGTSVTIAARYCYIFTKAAGSLAAGDRMIGFYDLNPLLVTVDSSAGFWLGETVTNTTDTNTVGVLSGIIDGTTLAFSIVQNAPATTKTLTGDSSGETAVTSGTATGNDANVSSTSSDFVIQPASSIWFTLPVYAP